jgi:predicted short-subunit dehydrogenase-like oxidoreductase (DUF2520 family)
MVLLSTAMRQLTSAGVDEAKARGALGALLVSAAENSNAMGPSAALTGPIVRGDVETVRAHLGALADVPEILELYRAMSSEALLLATEAGTDAARLEQLRRVLDERSLSV